MTEQEMLSEALLLLSHMRRRVQGDPSLTEWVPVGLVLSDVVRRADALIWQARSEGLIVALDVI